jgi:hypothetical protein
VTPYLAVLALMAVLILILAAWRQVIDLHEDDSIHLHENERGLVKAQVELAGKIKSIDRAGKAITIAAALYGLALAGWAVYQQWIGSTSL